MSRQPDISEKSVISVRKTSLKNIVKNNQVLDIIQSTVERVHTINFHTTHFLKQYLLYLFENVLPFPEIKEDFINMVMKTVCNPPTKRSGQPPSESNQVILKTLSDFYKQYYEPLLQPLPSEQRVDTYHLTDTLQYEETAIITAINNNIVAHFVDYVQEFVNRTFNLKNRLKEIGDRNDLTEEQKKLTKRNLSIELRKVKTDLLSCNGAPYFSSRNYCAWLNQHKPNIITKSQYHDGNCHCSSR